MQKFVAMMQSLVQYVKSLFLADTLVVSGKLQNSGPNKLPAVTPAASNLNGAPDVTTASSRAFRNRTKHVPSPQKTKMYAPMAKMTFQDAEYIREMIGRGAGTIQEAMYAYGVSDTTIRKILDGKSYRFDRPRILPPRYKPCKGCGKTIPDRIDGERIHPKVWCEIKYCSAICERVI